MKVNATQHLLEDEDVNFWRNSIWLGNDPDMNPAEIVGAIIKDKVEELMANEDRRDRYNHDALKTNLENTLQDLEDDTDLFSDLLCSMRKRFDALKAADGRGRRFQKLTGFGIGTAAPVPIPVSESGKNGSTFGSGYL